MKCYRNSISLFEVLQTNTQCVHFRKSRLQHNYNNRLFTGGNLKSGKSIDRSQCPLGLQYYYVAGTVAPSANDRSPNRSIRGPIAYIWRVLVVDDPSYFQYILYPYVYILSRQKFICVCSGTEQTFIYFTQNHFISNSVLCIDARYAALMMMRSKNFTWACICVLLKTSLRSKL